MQGEFIEEINMKNGFYVRTDQGPRSECGPGEQGDMYNDIHCSTDCGGNDVTTNCFPLLREMVALMWWMTSRNYYATVRSNRIDVK